LKSTSRFRGNDGKVSGGFESRLWVTSAQRCAATLSPLTSEFIPDSRGLSPE
jgi:hypothetical protein